MFDNSFDDQHRFNYSEPIDNGDDDTLDLNVMVNDGDNDVNAEIIPHIPEFMDAFRSSVVVSNDQTLSHKCILGGSELEVREKFSCKNELVNVVKR